MQDSSRTKNPCENYAKKNPKSALSSKAQFEGTVANLYKQIKSITTTKTYSNCFIGNKYLYITQTYMHTQILFQHYIHI